MNEILSAALAYCAAGLSVIPIGGDKRPYWSRLPQFPDRRRPGRTRSIWQPFRWRRAAEVQLVTWFGDGRANMGLVGGRISGGLLALDFDHEAAVIFPAWQERVGELAARLPVVATSKGFHVYLRARKPGGNRTLAWSRDGRKRIETRGEGGYVLAPPSRHPSGHIYQWIQGDHTAIPVLTDAALAALLAAATTFDERPQPKPHRNGASNHKTAVSLLQGSDSERLQRYAHAALHREVQALAQMPRGGRNDGLNRAAFCLGRYVGAGLLPQEMVEAHLQEACRRNGLLAEDGHHACWRTLVSGLEAGIRQAVTPDDVLARLRISES